MHARYTGQADELCALQKCNLLNQLSSVYIDVYNEEWN